MDPLRFWPSLAHSIVIATCIAVAWWRIAGVPGMPAEVPRLDDTSPQPHSIAAMTADATTRDSGADVAAVAARALLRPGLRSAEADSVAVNVRPTSIVVVDEPSTATPFPSFRMVGYIEQDDLPSVILQSVEDGTNHVVREGDDLGGVRVLEITPDSVVLGSNGRSRAVELYPD